VKVFCRHKESVTDVLKAPPDDEEKFILFYGFDAGLRRGEIVEARVDWFDLANGLLHVPKVANF
jgi:integrase